MSRVLQPEEDLEGALLIAKNGTRRWLAHRVRNPRRFMPADVVYQLIPQGWDVLPAQEHGRMNGGVRTIYRSADELYANGWRRVA